MELDLDGAHIKSSCLVVFMGRARLDFPRLQQPTGQSPARPWGHPGSGVFLWRRHLQMGLVGNLQEEAAVLVEESVTPSVRRASACGICRPGRGSTASRDVPLTASGVVSWNAIIKGYMQRGQGEVALDLFSAMKRRGFKQNAIEDCMIVCWHNEHPGNCSKVLCQERPRLRETLPPDSFG
ncbi:hypothetical protein SELMODRAFT_411297 [Selaginella moellendorffii]|uniref:Pentacotripeptide-repeat region of PRORP domain-containing protein n=1 Tax=Selaginella moellendorffii TaxID=88036 RepID=D8RH71_SELML|nr:hypothetical protein SELMODRAFT_411297 [Selaginella moellendorffii]